MQAASAQDDAVPSASAPPSVPPAQAPVLDEDPRVVLLVGSLDARWLARARGQLSDLPVVVVEERGATPADAGAEPQQARRLAEARGADVVAWLSSESPPAGGASSATSQSEVRIWLAQPGRLYRHRLGRRWDELSAEDRSAALEIAALTLRSAVRASTSEAADAPATAMDPEEAAPVSWRVGLGASWRLDGVTPLGMAGAGAELGVVWQRWSIAGGGSFGFTASAAAEGSDLLLSGHSVFLQATHALLERPSFSCVGLLRGGLGIHRRETRATASNTLPLPPRTVRSALLAGGARGSWHFTRAQALTLTLAATWQLAPPRYGIEELESEQVFEYAAWAISPALEIGWSMTL